MNKLIELRENNKKTQVEIATAINTHPVTYNNYERGKAKPSIETLIKLADYYNVSLDYLVDRDFCNTLGFLTKEQFENFKVILNLPENSQSKVFGYATSLAEQHKDN